MSNIEQCFRCHLKSDECGHYDAANPAACSHYVMPIDNSKMFARWYKFSGRIGRLEYVITLVAAVILYFFLVFGAGVFTEMAGIPNESESAYAVIGSICMLPSAYIAIAAGVKRTHDTRVSSWYALTPLIPLFFLNVFTLVICCAGCIYLFKDAGEEGVNEHGSNPAQPYAEQLQFEEMV
ncbi:MAG: DUF805 domain-containing protein [Muribaculaceae bacterium]|nr:DUF805 domain-containing protein [Muribaculaceae bacterium]